MLEPVLLVQGQSVTIPVTGPVLLFVIMLIGGAIGWNIGVRALISITLMNVIAYPLFVRGGQFVLDLINPFYTNLPRVVSLLLTGNTNAARLSPLEINLELGFITSLIGYLLVGFVIPWAMDRINFPGWYRSKPDDKNEPWSRALGALNGVLLALLLSSAAVAFWQDYQAADNPPLNDFLATALSILPDVGLFPLIGIVFFLVIILLSSLTGIWRPRVRM
jgi:hypothetical protein